MLSCRRLLLFFSSPFPHFCFHLFPFLSLPGSILFSFCFDSSPLPRPFSLSPIARARIRASRSQMVCRFGLARVGLDRLSFGQEETLTALACAEGPAFPCNWISGRPITANHKTPATSLRVSLFVTRIFCIIACVRNVQRKNAAAAQ